MNITERGEEKKKRNTVSLARLARRRRERNRKRLMAPVRRTLVAVWRGVGSSLVAKIDGSDGRSSTGPSSSGAASVMAGVVGSSDSWAIHVLWAEQREH